MSKKRTAAESSNDEQTTDGSNPVPQQQSDAKRTKLVSLSETTLEDLPIEVLECILVKVVVMEVKDMKLAKHVWKAKSDRVINRLCAVSLQWSSICANEVFRKKVRRTLDDTAQEMIRFEILHQYPIQFPVYDMACVKDEIFLLCRPKIGEGINTIKVVDCNNVAEVKDVIALPGISASCIEGCSVSNCVYVLNAELLETDADSVLRITKVEEHQFTLSPWIATDQKLSLLTVSANGNLVTISKHQIPKPAVVSVYAADGSLQHKIVLYPDICGHATVEYVIQKSNGNLVLISEGHTKRAQLMEIDTFGGVVRQYQSSLSGEFSVNFADIYDRILITNWESKHELLDSEFNLLDVSGVHPNQTWVFLSHKLHFNSERNEIMCIWKCLKPDARDFAVFRFFSQ